MIKYFIGKEGNFVSFCNDIKFGNLGFIDG